MRADRAGLAAAVVALAALAGGCSGGDRTVRIGVLADCRGLFGGFGDVLLAGAELPLVERGARLRGTKPSEGITPTRVGARRVELVTGCSELGEYGVLVEETRRLVELEHVDALVGGFGGGDAIVMRDLAHRYPRVAFVLAGGSRREATLVERARNLFRFDADDAQAAAGLGAYAFTGLHWRRAAIVAEDTPTGWAEAAAFSAEFCSRGGRLLQRVWLSPFERPAALRTREVDGVAALVGAGPGPASLKAVALQVGNPARRLVIGPWITADPQYRAALGTSVLGATTVSPIPAPVPSAGSRTFESHYHRAFPSLPASFAGGILTRTYFDAVDAVVRAIAAGGDLKAELQHVAIDVPGGRIHLDRNGQAVIPTVLLRLAGPSRGSAGSFERVRTLPPVDQTLGGRLRAGAVGRSASRCQPV